ncbi:MAG TPA: polysaccharide deacetylase family protein [Polyangia bacterium]
MARVALTFDDGPGPATPLLLDVLAARGVHATFFLLGTNVERARDVAVRIARAGHVVGNHTFTHARPGAIAGAALVDEIARNDALLADVCREAGVAPRRPIPVRLPYGPAPDDARLAALASIGRTHTHWTGDFGDWLEPAPDPAELAARMRAHIEAQARAGLAAVIDLHDSSRLFADRTATAEAVRLLLADAALELFTVPADHQTNGTSR